MLCMFFEIYRQICIIVGLSWGYIIGISIYNLWLLTLWSGFLNHFSSKWLYLTKLSSELFQNKRVNSTLYILSKKMIKELMRVLKN